MTGSAKDSSGVVWYQFSFGSRTGYVSSRYVNIKQPTVTPVSNTQGAVSDGPLRVRSGPGTGYSVLGSLATGKTFTVSGKAQDISGVWWYSFDYNGKTGYVSSQYVKTSSTSSSVVEVEKTTGTVNDGPLRVRTGPGTSYSVLGSLATGKSFYSHRQGTGQLRYVVVQTDLQRQDGICVICLCDDEDRIRD